jgi:hypothetical protein
MPTAKPVGVAVVREVVREGLCGCGSCRHTHSPDGCWSAASVGVEGGEGEEAEEEAAAAKTKAEEAKTTAAAAKTKAEEAKTTAAAAKTKAEEAKTTAATTTKAATKTTETLAAGRRLASATAPSRSTRLARLGPQQPGAGIALCAGEQTRAAPPGFPTRERSFGQDPTCQASRLEGHLAPAAGGESTRKRRQRSRRGAPRLPALSGSCLPLPPADYIFETNRQDGRLRDHPF